MASEPWVWRQATIPHGENVIHRDIKPENILLDGKRALVRDFGLARAIDRAALEPISSSGLVLGTPAYMSPEQATATKPVGPQATSTRWAVWFTRC